MFNILTFQDLSRFITLSSPPPKGLLSQCGDVTVWWWLWSVLNIPQPAWRTSLGPAWLWVRWSCQSTRASRWNIRHPAVQMQTQVGFLCLSCRHSKFFIVDNDKCIAATHQHLCTHIVLVILRAAHCRIRSCALGTFESRAMILRSSPPWPS